MILLFGAQNIAGDTFRVALGSPIDKADPALAIDLSLGISFSFQTTSGALLQRSLVNVNGARLTSMAGGQDDGCAVNGAMVTVGGIGDSRDNPPPLATSGSARSDDELYDLLPFLPDGATTLTVFSQNPSNDDNIFFAALNLRAAAAIIGEGIVLGPSPAPDTNAGTAFTVHATVLGPTGQPVAGREVTFTAFAGPHAGTAGTAVTDEAGIASFTYAGERAGLDEIKATFIDSQQTLRTSNTVIKRWIQSSYAPTAVCESVTRAVDDTCTVPVQPSEIGGRSFDLDGTPISLALSPAGPYQLGPTEVAMAATDTAELTATCSAVITAVDQTAPAIACPFAMTAECTGGAAALVTVRPVRTLSRGLEQRCALARALLHEPELLLRDGPFTGLDVDAAGMLSDLLRQAHAGGTTLLLVTHGLWRGFELCTRAVVLVRGRLVRDAPIGESTRDEFERTYVGALHAGGATNPATGG